MDAPPFAFSSLPAPDALDPVAVLRCFELARSRFPAPPRRGRCETAPGLASLAAHYDAFILDGYGVINVGSRQMVPGIVEAVRALRAAGKLVMVFTNGAGAPTRDIHQRYVDWQLDFPEPLVVSSRDSMAAALVARPATDGVWAAMATEDSQLATLPVETRLIGDDDEPLLDAADGFLFIRAREWTLARNDRLAHALRRRPRPVLVANCDVSSPLPSGDCHPEPGYWALRLEAQTSVKCEYFGKPFAPAFEIAIERLHAANEEAGGAPLRPERVAMVGDGLHTDILGGLAAGLGAVLMTDHGLIRELDWRAWAERIGIYPDHVIPGP